MAKSIIIDQKEILPGENTILRLSVGRLPSGNKIDILVHVFRSEEEGPTVLVLGGMHGDEINGMEIVRKSLEDGTFENLQRGTVITIPLLNIYGFINFSRDLPDGKDVNRSFPGSKVGSLASRVAGIITKKILPHIDFGMDFHTGGASRYNYPQIRYTKNHEKSRELALAFGAPFSIQKPLITRSLRKTAKELKVPIIVYEGGESVRLDGFAISKGLAGLKRVLHSEGMILSAPPILHPMTHFKRTGWVRASQSGIFIWSRSSGVKIYKGEPLGILKDPQGLRSSTVLAKQTGYIIGHNNASVVNQGDALFNIAYDSDQFV